jgi:hypothetical protein
VQFRRLQGNIKVVIEIFEKRACDSVEDWTMIINVLVPRKTRNFFIAYSANNEKTPWPQSVSEPYRPSDRRLSAKLVPESLWQYPLLSRPEPLLFLASSSSVVLTRLSRPRSRHTTFFSCCVRESNPGPPDL